jgi:hypothetical protein
MQTHTSMQDSTHSWQAISFTSLQSTLFSDGVFL